MAQKNKSSDKGATKSSKVTVRGKARVKAREIIGGDQSIGRDKLSAGRDININQVASPPISDADYTAARKKYLEQVIARTELLEFIGIPEHGKRQRDEIKLEDIFIPLGAEEEVEEHLLAFLDSQPGAFRQVQVERQIERGMERRARKTTRRVTLDDVLRNHTRMMVIGDPGAGKSTLLRYLTLTAARGMAGGVGAHPSTLLHSAQDVAPRQERRLPILIPLRSFAASGEKSLVAYFYTFVKQTYQLDLPAQFFERALDAGECLLCFDGLDEVVLPEQRVAVRDAVAALASRYPRNRFVVTSRIVGYEQAPLDRRAFAHHTVLPFTPDEIETFVHKWYHAREHDKNHAEAQADSLVKTIRENDRLLKLAENPLMLTIIALVHRIEAELPNERVKLYDKCTEALLGTWEGVKGLGVSERERDRPFYKYRRRLLEKLAFWMHTQSQTNDRQAEVKRGDLEMKLIELLCEDDKLNLSPDDARLEAQTFIAMAQSRTGILVERGDGIYSFLHLTFQEYFAACDIESRYIYNLDQMWRVIQPQLYHPRWREVILLLLGRLNRYDDPPSILVEKILNEHDRFDDVVYRNLFLAARCLADKVNVQETLHDQIVDQLLEVSQRGNLFSSLQEDTINILGTLSNDVHAAKGLLAIAHEHKSDKNLRSHAADTIGHLGCTDNFFIQGLFSLARNKRQDTVIGCAAIRSLGNLGRTDNFIIQELSALAHDKKAREVIRLSAAESLGQLGDSRNATLAVLELVRDDTTRAEMRIYAADSLVELGSNEEAAQLLLSFAQDSTLKELDRSDALESITELAENNKIVVSRTQIINGLLALAQKKGEKLRIRTDAVNALGHLVRDNETATHRLFALAQNRATEESIRLGAAFALLDLGHSDAARQHLRSIAKDNKVSGIIRFRAIEGLLRLGQTHDSIHLLLTLVQDNTLRLFVRSEAAQILLKVGIVDDSVIEILRELLQSDAEDLLIRLRVAEVLATHGHAVKAIKFLQAVAFNEKVDDYLRGVAAEVLGQIGRSDDTLLRQLLILAHSKNVDDVTRTNAVEALGKLGKKEPSVALGLLRLTQSGNAPSGVYDVLKEIVSNLRYADVVKQVKPRVKRKTGRKNSKARVHKNTRK